MFVFFVRFFWFFFGGGGVSHIQFPTFSLRASLSIVVAAVVSIAVVCCLTYSTRGVRWSTGSTFRTKLKYTLIDSYLCCSKVKITHTHSFYLPLFFLERVIKRHVFI